jgi:lipase
VRLHVHEWGEPDAPPVVCLHGVSGHGRRFRKLAEERLAARFRVLAFDLRGHGRSRWEPPWNIQTHVADVIETAAAAGVARASWLGNSFGGRLAIELAAREPERIERAVLLDPAIQLEPEFALAKAELERGEKVYSSVEDAIAARVAGVPLHHTPREILEEEMAEHLVSSDDDRLRYRYCQSTVVALWGELCLPPPPYPRLPTLLVLGARSDYVPPNQVESYRAAIGELLEVVTVPGGHLVYWDAFTETATAIERFLSPATSGLRRP